MGRVVKMAVHISRGVGYGLAITNHILAESEIAVSRFQFPNDTENRKVLRTTILVLQELRAARRRLSEGFGFRTDADHKKTILPFLANDSSTASSIRTTRKPANPSLRGRSFPITQSAKYCVSILRASTCSTRGDQRSPAL